MVTETLPAGFTYVSSSLAGRPGAPRPNDSQKIHFVLVESGDSPFTYTVTVSVGGEHHWPSSRRTWDGHVGGVTGDNPVRTRRRHGARRRPTRRAPTRVRVGCQTRPVRWPLAAGRWLRSVTNVAACGSGVVTETLPAGFTYVSSSLPDGQVRPDANDSQKIISSWWRAATARSPTR